MKRYPKNRHYQSTERAAANSTGSSSANQILYNSGTGVAGFGSWNGTSMVITGTIVATNNIGCNSTAGGNGTFLARNVALEPASGSYSGDGGGIYCYDGDIKAYDSSGRRYNLSKRKDISIVAGTSYNITESDRGRLLLFTNAGAIGITFNNGLTTGFSCEIIRANGAGAITLAAAGTLRTRGGLTAMAANGKVEAAHVGGNEWYVTGDLA